MKRKKGRYQSNDRKVSKREYMSYEDVPIKDYEDTEPIPKNLTKKFLKVFLILFLSVVTLLALLNIDSLTPENISHWFEYDLLGKSEGDGYPVLFSGTNVNVNNFDIMDSVPVYCSDTSVVVLNSNGGEYQNNQHAYANPVLKSNSNYSIVYNVGATGYKIINKKSVVNTASANNKIFSADVSSNGVYAILTQGEDYLSNLMVYRSDNLEKYEYNFADYYVNNVSISKDGTRAVLSGVSAKYGGMISAVYILDFSQDSYLQKYEIDDTYIYSVCYLENGNAVAVGDSAAYYINVEKGEKSDISYNNRTLTCYNADRDYGLLLSLSKNPDGKECEVVMVDRDGNSDINVYTGTKITSLDYCNDKISVLSPSTVDIYDKSGTILSTIDAGGDARKVCFVNSDMVYILGKSRISQLNIEYKN